jgi:hypothetical protein
MYASRAAASWSGPSIMVCLSRLAGQWSGARCSAASC